ncbi:hypothetical protein, partial [Roseibacillus persicicus]|uniref:hypothetical protein n=1 Tax=Roseibacillus persicicus TaxID=454148 RepID=UPI0028109ADD
RSLENMIHPWSMQISLRLGEHGWSELDLWLEDEHKDFCITHIFDSPMASIAEALLSLRRGSSEASFVLHEEPGRNFWRIAQLPKKQHLLLVEISVNDDNFDNSFSAPGLVFEVERDFFIGSFILELDKIAFQLRFPRFAVDRTVEDFPWDALAELKSSTAANNAQHHKSDRAGESEA